MILIKRSIKVERVMKNCRNSLFTRSPSIIMTEHYLFSYPSIAVAVVIFVTAHPLALPTRPPLLIQSHPIPARPASRSQRKIHDMDFS